MCACVQNLLKPKTNFLNFTGVFPMKNWSYQSLNANPYVGKLTLVQYILFILPFTVLKNNF